MNGPLKVTAVLLALALVGCSDDAQEVAAEKAVEKQLGQDAKVDIDREGMRIETGDGTLSIASGQSAEVPDDFPKDVLIYEPGSLTMAMRSGEGYTLSLSTQDTPAKVVEAYSAAMGKDGWQMQTQMDMGPQKMLIYQKGERMANIAVAAVDDATQVTVSVMRSQ